MVPFLQTELSTMIISEERLLIFQRDLRFLVRFGALFKSTVIDGIVHLNSIKTAALEIFTVIKFSFKINDNAVPNT